MALLGILAPGALAKALGLRATLIPWGIGFTERLDFIVYERPL